MIDRFFIITVDTEGDNLWDRSKSLTTDNARYLCRFQTLCEKFSFYPTYLTNYEMAQSPDFQDLAQDVIRRNTAEIGMHLHAWNSPPAFDLTENDNFHHPYLIEYPSDVMAQKIDYMTNLLEDLFGQKMVSHRAGRWSFDEQYADMLIKHGYKVDCSVTPHQSWREIKGDPNKNGGTDYSKFPEEAYFLNLEDIGKKGNSSLLELPVTIMKNDQNRLCWLRPMKNNLQDMLYVIDTAIKQNRLYLEFMIHSSELMPAGSPTFPSNEDIESLYEMLNVIFDKIRQYGFKGSTLQSFADYFIRKGQPHDSL